MTLKQLKRIEMQQNINISLIEQGKVLETNHKIKAFKMFGVYYTTNFKRKYRYEFDDASWRHVNYGFLWKLKGVLLGKVKRLNLKPERG